MALSTRMQALSNLAETVPSKNSQLARQRQQAQRIQMRQQLAGAQPGALNTTMAGQAGAQAQKQAQTAAAQAQEQTLRQQGQIGQLQTGEMRLAGQQQIADKQELIDRASIHLSNKLNMIDQDAKQRIFDERMQFSADEAQRGLMQQRQLADFALLSAQSRQQYLDRAQKAEQWKRKQIQLMEQNYKTLMQKLENFESLREQGLDQSARRRAQETLARYRELIEKRKADAANNRSMWGAGGTIIGAVIGGIYGGPGGAKAGGSIGGGIGGAVGGATS